MCFPARKLSGRCTDESSAAEDSASEAEDGMHHNGRRSKSYDATGLQTTVETPI